jgi:hypothetical protein
MTAPELISQIEAWQSGSNVQADQALNLSRNALIQGKPLLCFACLRDAMSGYGWEFHSDRKARRLWSAWERLNARLQSVGPINDAKLRAAIEDFYHATYRAVHFDRDRRIRRNMPPDNPAARIESLISVGIPRPS